MSFVVTISGSPSESSKSATALRIARGLLEEAGIATGELHARDLNAEDLLYGRVNSPAIVSTIDLIARADGVLIATPIYKAAYTGILKAYLDLLPQNAFARKVILPIATGATPAHMLAIDYALRPVLLALGAQYSLTGVYLLDSQWVSTTGTDVQLDALTGERFAGSIRDFIHALTFVRPV